MPYFYRNTTARLSLLTFFYLFVWEPIQAQPDTLVRNKIWVKLEEALPINSSQNGLIKTGKPSLDQLNQDCSVIAIRPIFSPSPKFKKAHHHYGLHLWYELEFADTLSTSVQELSALFCKNNWVATAEAIPVRTLFNSSTYPTDSDTLSESNDPRYQDQWHFNNTGQSDGTVGADIRLASAWPVTSGDAKVVVAVIDGGIDTQHEDLKQAMWVNQLEEDGEFGVDDDGNGYVDDVYGFDFSVDRGKVYADQHGTHVAGTVGAVTNNGIGVAGVAGGNGKKSGVRLMSCAVFSQRGQGGFPEAFVYAADNGAVIAQNSWGGGGKSQVLEDAINYFVARAGYDNTNEKFDQNIQTGPMAGGLVVFAAGNNKTSSVDVAYPASLESVIAVTSLDHNDEKSDFANYGDWVDIAAPGSEVLSTLPSNSYGYLSGTSMACPHVSGVAALVVSHFQGTEFTNRHLHRILLSSTDAVDAINRSYREKLGRGRINAFQAVSSDTKTPPAAITDLAVSGTTFQSANLNWTAVGADSLTGAAAYYEIRVSEDPTIPDNDKKTSQFTLPKLPLTAGEADSFEVPGLKYTTTYYFSLRAVDLLGQSSPWSSIVEATTQEPPRIEVEPSKLTATVESGESVIGSLTISNATGKSPLSFRLIPDSITTSEEWFRLSLDSGIVEVGAAKKVEIKWNARSLYAGSYLTKLQVVNNDPDNSLVEILVQLKVTGSPKLDLSVSRIDFRDVYQTFSKARILTIRNTGTDTLRVQSLETESSIFQSQKSKLTVAPGEKEKLEIVFSPEIDEEQIDTLTITSNDPEHPSHRVVLQGVGLIPPLLLLQPQYVSVEVVQQDSLSRIIRLQNTDFDDTLHWSVASTLPDWLTVSTSSGSLAPRGTTTLRLQLRTGNLALGEYSTEIAFLLTEEDSVILPVSLAVVEPNFSPVWADSLLTFTVHIDETEAKFDLTEFIYDPEEDTLHFDFQTTNQSIAKTQLIDGVLSVIPQLEGTISGLLTATDAAGNQAKVSLSLIVLPPNQQPEPIQEVVSLKIYLSDETVELNLDSLFLDPDGDSLTYSFTRPSFSTDDLAILESPFIKLQIQNQQLIGEVAAVGKQRTVIYAYDPSNLYTITIIDFIILPPNKAPLVRQKIDAQQLIEKEQLTVYLSEYFTDPNEDSLTYQVEISDTTIAQAHLSTDSLRITAHSPGKTSVRLIAQDQAGEEASISFTLKVARVTSLAPVPDQAAIQIYPNPTTDWVSVICPQIQAVDIYDIQGKLFRREIVSSGNEANISLVSLPPGMYQVVVFGRQGLIHRTLLLKE